MPIVKRPLRLALLLATCLAPVMALADATFPQPHEFKGRFRVESATPGQPITAGSQVKISGSGLQPGQKLVLQRGPDALTKAPVVADEKGQITLGFTLPQEAAKGLHPLIAILEEPSMVTTVDLKVSQPIPYLAEGDWKVAMTQPAKGLYQSAFSPRARSLYVTAADFTNSTSELLKLDPTTLEVQARITPADFPEDQKPPKKEGGKGFKLAPAGVFGLGVDDEHGRIWVTNTPDNTIAVYAQDDLALVKQFAPGTVYHSRDVLIDPASKTAFVSSSASSNVYAFDLDTLEQRGKVDIRSAERGGDFYVMSLAVDSTTAELYVVSRVSNELAVIDTKTLAVKRVLPLPGAKNATGLAVDPATGRLFVASQDSDNLLILDRESGKVLHDVALSAGALSVTYDAVNDLAWVASREAGSLSAVDKEGKVTAHLDGGSYANHITTDGEGVIYATNKSLGPDDAKGDHLRRLTAAQ